MEKKIQNKFSTFSLRVWSNICLTSCTWCSWISCINCCLETCVTRHYYETFNSQLWLWMVYNGVLRCIVLKFKTVCEHLKNLWYVIWKIWSCDGRIVSWLPGIRTASGLVTCCTSQGEPTFTINWQFFTLLVPVFIITISEHYFLNFFLFNVGIKRHSSTYRELNLQSSSP